MIGLTALDANQVVERLKWHQRQTSGWMHEAELTQIRKQLQEGGPARPLSVSATSKALSAQIREMAQSWVAPNHPYSIMGYNSGQVQSES
ncbi:MAG: hypothetical protein K8T91_13695 [Planctomycetes bacterium]|nr:hypothetical protein [Planctomycetota bacterium]